MGTSAAEIVRVWEISWIPQRRAPSRYSRRRLSLLRLFFSRVPPQLRHHLAGIEREQKRTDVTKKHWIIKACRPWTLVRDEGVAGSNPATPTTT